MSETYLGAVAPEGYSMTVGQGLSGVNMTTVSAASFKVLKPDSSELTWTATISAASPTEVTLTYNFTGTSDLTLPGTYYVYALLTVAGGFLRSKTCILTVRSKYEPA